MSTVTIVDPQIIATLSKLKEVTEIRDQNGTSIGMFTPVSASGLRALFDRDEIQRRKEQARGKPGLPMAAVVEKLRSLESGSS